MGVTMKNAGEKAGQDAAETVKLEVVGVKRYVPLKGPLYEAGVIYTFTKAQAARVLKIHIEGKPVFDHYKPERHKKVVQVGPEERDMTSNDVSDLVPLTAARIDIGDDSELDDIPGLRESPAEDGGVRV